MSLRERGECHEEPKGLGAGRRPARRATESRPEA